MCPLFLPLQYFWHTSHGSGSKKVPQIGNPGNWETKSSTCGPIPYPSVPRDPNRAAAQTARLPKAAMAWPALQSRESACHTALVECFRLGEQGSLHFPVENPPHKVETQTEMSWQPCIDAVAELCNRPSFAREGKELLNGQKVNPGNHSPWF